MPLADVPIVLILAGLAAYTVLGGADFGIGFWQLTGRGRRNEVRDFTHNAIAPVWEANHVWLIFVFVVCWTAYPTAFGSIASTLSVPLFVAALGIILWGMAYALRGRSGREERIADNVFATASILTPFALGAAVGGIASGRVPVGNAQGSLVTSWLNPTSIVVGVLAASVGIHLAAVLLAGDAVRSGDIDLADAFRARALTSGVASGAIALAGLAVLNRDAPRIWNGLTTGAGLAAVLVSAGAGLGTLYLVSRGAFYAARPVAALSVAAIIAGWGAAQQPIFLPGLTIDQAAAGHSTLVALVVGIAIGAIVLVPSLALLFSLVQRGRFSAKIDTQAERPERPRKPIAIKGAQLGVLAAVSFVAGVGLEVFAGSSWAFGLGIASLFISMAAAFTLIVGPNGLIAFDPPDDRTSGSVPRNRRARCS